MAKTGIICQSCGLEAPSKYVEFYQNIGMLVMRTHKTVKGNLCKRCVHKHFWQMQLTNVTVGWWGTISIIVTPIFVINNLVRYLGAIGMPPVPADARVPMLTDEALKRLEPHAASMIGRLNSGHDPITIATECAREAGVTPGQALRYMVAIVQSRAPQPPTGGFPVTVKSPPPATPPAKPVPVVPIDAEPLPVASIPAPPQPDPGFPRGAEQVDPPSTASPPDRLGLQ